MSRQVGLEHAVRKNACVLPDREFRLGRHATVVQQREKGFPKIPLPIVDPGSIDLDERFFELLPICQRAPMTRCRFARTVYLKLIAVKACGDAFGKVCIRPEGDFPFEVC